MDAMDRNTKFATILVLALGTIGTTATAAFAQTQSEQIDTVDEIVHGATGGAASENDVRFHQALCTVGISSTALESLGGCEALPPIGSE
jgi:hypothetical protein